MKKQQNNKTIYILPCIAVWLAGVLVLLGCMFASHNAVCAYAGCRDRVCENSLFCSRHTPEARREQKYHAGSALREHEMAHTCATNRCTPEELCSGLCLNRLQ